MFLYREVWAHTLFVCEINWKRQSLEYFTEFMQIEEETVGSQNDIWLFRNPLKDSFEDNLGIFINFNCVAGKSINISNGLLICVLLILYI